MMNKNTWICGLNGMVVSLVFNENKIKYDYCEVMFYIESGLKDYKWNKKSANELKKLDNNVKNYEMDKIDDFIKYDGYKELIKEVNDFVENNFKIVDFG